MRNSTIISKGLGAGLGVVPHLRFEAIQVVFSQLLALVMFIFLSLVMLLIHLSLMFGLSMCSNSLLFKLFNEAFKVIILYGLQLHLVI